MAEQLSFHLEPRMPNPGDVAPMWPTPRPDAFDSADWLFEPTWGGHRVLAFVGPADQPGGGEVRVVDARGASFQAVLPELAGLAVRVAARSAVLDGELVAVDGQGHADDDALRRRLSGQPGRRVALLVFDLLHLDGRWLLGQPLERRRAALRRILRPGDEVVTVPAILGEGLALHAAVSAQGVAGVLARQRTSPYLPGVRSTLWRSIEAGPPDAGTGESVEAEPDANGFITTPATAPVLAIFRRLPLPEDPDQ